MSSQVCTSVLCLLQAAATSAYSTQSYLSNIPVCGSFYGFTRTFPNAQEFVNGYIGNGWQILNTGPCPPVSECKVYNPVCGVSSAGKYQTFFNSCLMQADWKLTGTAWQIKSLGICSYNPTYISAAASTTTYTSPSLPTTKLEGMLKYIEALSITPANQTVAEVVATDTEQPASEAAATSEQPAVPLLNSTSFTFTVSVPEQVLTNATESSAVSVAQETTNSTSSSTPTVICTETTVEIPVVRGNETVIVAQTRRECTESQVSSNTTVTAPIASNYTQSQLQPTTYQSSVASSYYAPKVAQYQTSPVYVTSPQTSTSSASATTTDNITIPAKLYEQLLRLYQVAVSAGKLPAVGTSYYPTYSQVGPPQ